MVSAHDVAAFILREYGEMTAMKLQKLLYYCQAWSLVWDDQPLFGEDIQAWANGPVIPEIYQVHRGLFKVKDWPIGDPGVLDFCQEETVRAVVNHYGPKPAQWLSDLTHIEDPWRNARRGVPTGERGNCVIQLGDMYEYYSSL